MKNLRFVHIGDMHLDPKYQTKNELSLNQILDYCKRTRINGVIIPGDILHCKQSYSSSSAVPVLFDFIRKLAQLVDFIFITKGNHDEPGSISLLHKLEPNIYAYEYPVCLSIETDDETNTKVVYDMLREDFPFFEPNYIVSLVPYPQKSGFITNTSIDNNNNEFLEKFEQLFELIGDVTQPYTCPKILAFHGNVVGSRLSSGQSLVSQDIMVAPSTLEKAKADYYALNHIHLRQEIRPNIIYAGGIGNFNWGETEPKSFEVIEFDNWICGGELEGKMSTHQIKLSAAKPMIKIEAEISGPFKEIVPLDEYTEFCVNPIEAEYRIRITLEENERNLITEEKIHELKKLFGNDVKIELNIIPNERESRSEKIMDCKSLLDEVKEYAAVIEQPISESIENKVFEVQEVEL